MKKGATSSISILCLVSLMGTFGIAIPQNASAESQANVSVGFESGWDSSWSANDYNSASGLDHWGISTYRSHSGTHSVWCAEVGTNSINSIANNANHYYDQDMYTWLEIPIGDISAWSSATLSFYVWYLTGSFSLADYLWVGNSSDGSSFYYRWTQPSVTSSGWQLVSFDLATSTTSIVFAFASDPTVGLGPYEGVYVDDIVVTVTDSENPTSSVGSLASFQTTSSFSIPYTASDLGGSGLAYVELYYRPGTSGAFTLYTTGTNPSGQWTASPIVFDSSDAAGDGQYQFYTCATDGVGDHEDSPSSPDAGTTVDTSVPSTTLDVAGTLGSNGWYISPVSVTLVGSDITSDVASTFYRLDAGDWMTYSASFLMSSEGTHVLDYYSVDNAGNSESYQSCTVKIDTMAPATDCTLTGTEGLNGWYVGEYVTMNLAASDSSSRVSSIKLKTSYFGTWREYSCPIMFLQSSWTICYYASDIAGNVETEQSISFKIDSSAPTMAITHPLPDSKISRDSVTIEWSGADYVSEIDHYELQVDGGNWIPMGMATSFELVELQDKWYSIKVKAVDKAGNSATSTVSFGIYTSAWSTNGPYDGIPLFALIAAAVIVAVLSVLLYRRKRGGAAVTTVSEEESAPETAHIRTRTVKPP